MVRDLEKENRLDQAVFEAQEKAGDLLYELVSVKKMDYQAAWELAREEWALPQGENKTENNSEDQNGNLPPAETSPSGTSRSTTSRRSWLRGRRRGTSG
jgi:hypothetical protein